MVAATREGPSRLTSTAVSKGASKATAAAEWTTMSRCCEQFDPRIVEAETLRRDVASDGGEPVVPPSRSNPSPSSARKRSKQSLRTISRLARSDGAETPCRPDQNRDPASGHRSEEPLDEGGAEEPRRPGDEDQPAREGIGNRSER